MYKSLVRKRTSLCIVFYILLLQSSILHAKDNYKYLSVHEVEHVTPDIIINVGEAWVNNAINTTVYRHHGIVTPNGAKYLGGILKNAGELKFLSEI